MNNENELSEKEKRFEERLRQFHATRPPDSCWESIADRMDSASPTYWLPAALAAAVILVIAMAGAFVWTRQARVVEQPQQPDIAGSQTDRIRSVAYDGGPCLELSLGRLNRIAEDPLELLNYLDSHGWPLRAGEEIVTPLTKSNGV